MSDSEMRPRRKRSRKVVYLGRALILVFLISLDIGMGTLVTWLIEVDIKTLEKELRVESERYHHDLRPNVQLRTMWLGWYEVTTNSLGFKDQSRREVPLQAEEERILFLGDSFTEGVGLPYEETFVGRIDAALRPKGYDALNAGVVSYSPIIYWKKAEYIIEEIGLDIDHLVVFMDISDIEDEILYELDEAGNVVASKPDSAHGFGASLEPRTLRRIVKRHSLLLRSLDVLKDTYYSGWPQTVDEMEGTYLLSDERVVWTFDDDAFASIGVKGLERATQHMAELIRLADRHDIQVYLAVYPWPTQVMRRDHPNRQTTYWRSWAEANGVPFLDATDSFVNDEDPMSVLNRYYFPGDCHFNAAGNEVIAQRFLKFWADAKVESKSPSDSHRSGP